jgi:type III secretory pathway component EscV
MNDTTTTAHADCEIALTIDLAAPLSRSPLAVDACLAVERSLNGLLEQLGVPGRIAARIVSRDSTDKPGKLIGLRIGRTVCRYPEGLLLSAFGYVTGNPLVDHSSEALREWLNHAIATGQGEVNEWLVMSCVEIIKRQPSRLLTDEAIRIYLEKASRTTKCLPHEQRDLDFLRAVLRRVLDLRISLRDVATLSEQLAAGTAKGMSADDLAEDLIAALRPPVLGILTRPEDLDQITREETDKGLFGILRAGLFYELGIEVPDLQFVSSDECKSGSFAFRINHVTTMSRHGLPATKCLVDEKPAELQNKFGVIGEPLLNPARGNANTIIDARDRERLPPALQVWTPLGFVVLSLAAELREKAPCLIDLNFTRTQLGRTQQAFPALTEACQTRYSLAQLTRLFRGLIAEGISIRDFRGILGATLDFDMLESELRYIVIDDRLPSTVAPSDKIRSDPASLVGFVRLQIKRVITHAHCPRENVLYAYQLDPQTESEICEALERMVRSGVESDSITEWFGEDRHSHLVETLREALGDASPLAAFYPILTVVQIRPWLRQLLSDEYPRMPILAYQELTPASRIHRLAMVAP